MMALIKEALLLIQIYALLFDSGYSKISVTPNTAASETIYQSVEKILTTCFQDNLNPLIATESIRHEFRQFSILNQSIPLITVDNNFKPNEDYRHYPKSATFVLDANSVHETEKILSILKSSIWWNIDSVFLLVGSDSCNDASAILHVAWQKKLLSTIFICRHNSNDTVMIYTFNPFTNRAPYPWSISNNFKKSKDPWTLYSRQYDTDNKICEYLIYDKFRDMDGYKLRALVIPTFPSEQNSSQTQNFSLTHKESSTKARFFNSVFTILNITARLSTNVESGKAGESFDLVLNGIKLSWYQGWIPAYPCKQVALSIGTRQRPFLTPVEKIVSFYSIGAILSICAIFGIVIIALTLNRRQRLSSASLEVVRLVAASSIQQPLRKQPLRIYFFGVFWLFLIINATFKGNLVKFLTKPKRPAINSLSDLQNFKKILIHPLIYEFNKQELLSLNKSIRFLKSPDDLKYLLNDFYTAAIMPSQYMYRYAIKFQLHVSKPFHKYYSIPRVSPRFPFVKQINKYVFRWFESGLQRFWENQEIFHYKEKLLKIEAKQTHYRVRPITLSDLSFAFKFLAFGLGCSFVVFIMEIASGGKTRTKPKRVRLRRKRPPFRRR